MLNKPTKIDLADSNIAGLGTELEKKVRLEAASTEKAWAGIGKAPGTAIWRIEQFKVVAVPQSDYGKFFSGDSYIVLHTYKESDQLKHNVHFWLGLETTQDEAGTAAYKTVELDDYLAGEPVQFREVQGYETQQFLGYFPNFMVSEGGVASGFKHVEAKEYTARLYQVKGSKTSLVIRQVPLTHKSLNSGDVFILDTGLVLYQWNGSKANGHEKSKSMQFVNALASERKGAKVTVFDEGDKDAAPFWTGIGGEGPVASADEGGRDSQVDRSQHKLFQVSDASGELNTTLVATGNLKKSMLKSEDVFIVDTKSEVYVWVGKGASASEKKNGLQIAIKHLNASGLPPTTPISRVLEGGENASFNSLLA